MLEPIVSRALIHRLFTDAHNEMDRDDAVLHVAGVTGLDPVVIESVLASFEAMHSAVMEAA